MMRIMASLIQAVTDRPRSGCCEKPRSQSTPRRTATHVLHVVEIRYAGENFRELMRRVRGGLNTENVQANTFRYWFSEPDAVVRVNFESEEQARAFAEAFGESLVAVPLDWLPQRRTAGPRARSIMTSATIAVTD